MSAGKTKTTATRVSSDCATVFGCELEDKATTKTTISGCTGGPQPTRSKAARENAVATAYPRVKAAKLRPRVDPPLDPSWADDTKCTTPGPHLIIYPRDHSEAGVARIRQRLEHAGPLFYEVGATNLGYIAYFHVDSCPVALAKKLGSMPEASYPD